MCAALGGKVKGGVPVPAGGVAIAGRARRAREASPTNWVRIGGERVLWPAYGGVWWGQGNGRTKLRWLGQVNSGWSERERTLGGALQQKGEGKGVVVPEERTASVGVEAQLSWMDWG